MRSQCTHLLVRSPSPAHALPPASIHQRRGIATHHPPTRMTSLFVSAAKVFLDAAPLTCRMPPTAQGGAFWSLAADQAESLTAFMPLQHCQRLHRSRPATMTPPILPVFKHFNATKLDSRLLSPSHSRLLLPELQILLPIQWSVARATGHGTAFLGYHLRDEGCQLRREASASLPLCV